VFRKVFLERCHRYIEWNKYCPCRNCCTLHTLSIPVMGVVIGGREDCVGKQELIEESCRRRHHAAGLNDNTVVMS